MRYKIEKLEDITDSKEILKAKPKGFSMYMTYIILALLICMLIWSLIAQKEVSVNLSGVVKPAGQVTEISSDYTGKVTTVSVKDGQTVAEGDVLLVLDGDEDTVVVAPCDGVVQMDSGINLGQYIEYGTEIAEVLPGETSGYTVQVTINNQNIGEVKEGQETSIELAALPGSEYGYISSILENISSDAKVAESDSGSTSYYTAECSIDTTSMTNKKGENSDIRNGMIAQVRVISRRVTYFKYFLEMLGIVD